MLAKKDICLSRCLFLRLDLAAYLHAVPLAQTHQYSRCLGPGRLAEMCIRDRLYLRFARSDDPLLTRVRNLFVLFPGQQTAVLYLADSKRRLGARCLLHPALLQELKELLGEENVVLQ